MRLYSEEQPQEAVPHLEAALQQYFVAEEECRALCEGPYDYDGYNYLEYNADLFQAITGALLRAQPSTLPQRQGQCRDDTRTAQHLQSHF